MEPLDPLDDRGILKLMVDGANQICDYAISQHAQNKYHLREVCGQEGVDRWIRHWNANRARIQEVAARIRKEEE